MEMAMEAPSERSRSHPPVSRPTRPPPPSTTTEITDLDSLQQCHDNAYRSIEQGLSADELGNHDEAHAFYQSGLKEVNKALNVNCERLRGTDEVRDKGKTLQQKLTKTKLQIEYRMQSLKETVRSVPSAPASETDCEMPPSYEAATSGHQSDADAQFAALGDSIMEDQSDSENSLVANATEVFSIQDGVQIFHITPEGYVSAPSYPSALKIFKFNDQPESGATAVERPPAFLQVGDWFYPLLPGASPVLQSNYGAYLFPDVSTQEQHDQGNAVGLMIPETVSQVERERFERMLESLTALRHQEEAPVETVRAEDRPAAPQGPESTSTKISKGLLVAADYISWGVGKGAEKAGELIKYGSNKLRAHLHPVENPKPVDPRLQKGIQYARVGSHVAVKVSSYVVKKLGQATMALASEAAPHIRKQGEKILPKSLKTQDSKSKMDGVVEVAASGIKGFSTVFLGLEAAAKALGKSLANETVEVVNHKYGNDAGKLTENTLYSLGNVAMTAYNVDNLGVKAIAKRAAKDTGKAVLKDISEKKQNGQPKDKQNPNGNGQAS